jgi:hypothetical protein
VIHARVDWPQDESRDQQAPRYFRTQKLHSNAEQFLRDSEFRTDLGIHFRYGTAADEYNHHYRLPHSHSSFFFTREMWVEISQLNV